MERRCGGRRGTHIRRESERMLNEKRRDTTEKDEARERGIEKQFTRKSALDLSAPRRLFLIGVSRCIADGFCVLSRTLFIQLAFAAARRDRLLQYRNERIKERI